MTKYLDLNGLTKYNSKIKQTYLKKTGNDSLNIKSSSNASNQSVLSDNNLRIVAQTGTSSTGTPITSELSITVNGITKSGGAGNEVYTANGNTIKTGVANGLASLDGNGRIPLSQLGNLDTTVAEVVTALPTTNIKKHIYMVKSSASETQNIYKEYIYMGTLPISDTNKYDASKWEELGEYKAQVDLTPYSKKTETVNGVTKSADANNVSLSVSKADGSKTTATIAAATSTVAGAMSGQDKKNLDRLIADTYPFGITSFTNNAGGTLEKGTTKSFNLSWAYKNTDYNPIKSQKVKGGNLSAEVTVANGTLTYAISNLTDSDKTAAKTFTYTLTAVGGSTTKTATTSVTFVHRSYAGVVAASKTALTAADIKALTNTAVQNNKARTISVSQNNQKIAYCYPAYLGNLSSIKDGNGFQGFSGYTKSTVDVDGVTYNVYLQNTAAISNGTYAFA